MKQELRNLGDMTLIIGQPSVDMFELIKQFRKKLLLSKASINSYTCLGYSVFSLAVFG